MISFEFSATSSIFGTISKTKDTIFLNESIALYTLIRPLFNSSFFTKQYQDL